MSAVKYHVKKHEETAHCIFRASVKSYKFAAAALGAHILHSNVLGKK